MSFSQSETGKDSAQMSAAGITGSAEPTPSDGKRNPETVTISLPALRAVVLGVIDERRWRFYSHLWANDDTAETEAVEHCEQFVDLICERLRQLPARG